MCCAADDPYRTMLTPWRAFHSSPNRDARNGVNPPEPTVPPNRHTLVPRIPAVFASRALANGERAARSRLIAAICALGVAATAASAQQPAPRVRTAPRSPDVYLAPLTVRDGVPTIGSPMNITNRAGYDNQPAFLDDGSGVLFTSVRDDAQADIYRYDFATRRLSRVTTTAPESEYSATPIEGGRAISVVRVERDSAQRLWRFPLDGGAPSVILERVKPVGYHAWADDRMLALFVLGSPNTLQLADSRTSSADTIATNIGRSLHRIPGTRRVSFVRKVAPTEWWIESLDVGTRQATRLVRLPDGVEDYAWLPSGSVLCGRGSTLLWWSGQTGDDWRTVADLSGRGVRSITRLAVSPRGDRLAFVAEEP